ncbi:unnamed protein product [Paramecium primaurelia]|uniref:Insulin-like growth factor binding protein, N-terminal n=1 Tax=Paramecium primaurelia TaxID=5886 RepID=A0A8S1QJI7_PARPR|nr:unnamed protein product [Paramecium primaurelia]
MFLLITYLLKITYQQTLFYSAFTDTTLTNAENWSFIGINPLDVIQLCGPYSIVGGYEKFALGIAATKFLLLPPHYKIQISFTLFIIDTWDQNEYFHLYVDESLVYNKAYSYEQGINNICGQTGNHRSDSSHEIQFEFPHTGTTTFIQLTSTLDQIPFDESWGFRNFRIFLYLCPSGCLTCSQSDTQTECKTWIITNTFFTETQYDLFSTDGWNILNGDYTKQQCSMIPSTCGYGVCGKDTKLTLNLVSLPFHTRMKIKFKYLKIDSWEYNDYAILQVNQNLRWKQRLSELNQYLYQICGGSAQDTFINVELTFPHYLTSSTITISNTLDQIYSDESFGIRDIEIFVQQSICGDTIIQENEECDDGNLDPFDGCFNCVFSCVDGCSLCHKGICLGCYSGWLYLRYASTCEKISYINSDIQIIAKSDTICYDYIEGCQECLKGICIQCQKGYQLKQESNDCQSICGDNIVTIKEECDGQNCIQCKFICPNFCDQCEFGVCQVCQQDYYLQNNQCIKQTINLCQTQCEVCIDSVCYKCQYGHNLVLGECQEICGNNSLALYSLDECTCNPFCLDCRFGYCYQCRQSYYLINNTCINICGDMIVQEDEECDDGNEIEFDGCFGCQFSCPLNCQDCQKGICLDSCQYGYQLINNECITICGDLIIAGTEQCEDNNKINYDGCYQCQYSCPLYCNDCINGQCLMCDIGYILYENMCTNICGDGVLSNLEQCDDGNQNDGDGCSSNCFVEINWICKQDDVCNYVKYPTLISEYLMQKNQYQYIKITFSQPVQTLSNINYIDTINASIMDINETLFNITIMEVQPALFNKTSEVQYVMQIEIFQSLDYYPILEIKLTEQLYNDNQASLIFMIDYLQLKQPNYITEEQIQIASTFQQINEVSVQSLCLLTILLMLLGNALSFWGILDALQEQSYLKFINVLYPQTLIIYFSSSKVVSVQPALDTITLYKNEGKLLQFPYLQSYEKFEFYEINADIAEGFRAELFIFATLFGIYIGTSYGVKILQKLELSEFLSKQPKLIRLIQKIKQKVNAKMKDAKGNGLKNTLRACTWDLIFMALLELKATHYFESPRSWVCILIAISILITTIIILLNQVEGLKSWKKQNFHQFWQQKRDIFQVTKKFLILYILVFYQYEQELQTLILTLINAFYLVYIINFKYIDDNLEYVKTIVMETSLTIFTASTFVNWNIVSQYLLYSQRIIIGWIQMSILVSVLIIFIFIELYNTYSLVKKKIIESREKKNRQQIDQKQKEKQEDLEQGIQKQKSIIIKEKTIFSRAQYKSKVYPQKI